MAAVLLDRVDRTEKGWRTVSSLGNYNYLLILISLIQTENPFSKTEVFANGK